MNGFFLIDKPTGISSFDCIRRLRRVCNIRRMGFAGTLDPLASGLMILAVGEATKLLSYLEKSDKVYEVLITLGATSDTFDVLGSIRPQRSARPQRSEIAKVIEDCFLGLREQVPPKFSAIHINGQRAYDLARKGQEVEMKPRQVHFFEIKLKSYSWPDLRLQVHCSSGTYVRSLAHDLGQKLGCGGYVKELRRLKVGNYSIKDAVGLDEVVATNFSSFLLKPQEFFKDWQQINLGESHFKILANGGMIENAAGLVTAPILAIYNNNCVGVLEIKNDQLKFARKINN